jgi:ADP-ribose pyrophosphatase YjhB (NUDIX family)
MTMIRNSKPQIKRAAGCVVYRISDGSPQILLIHDKYGRWTLPKGHLEPGETERDAAVREVFEETAIGGELGPPIERIGYTVTKNGRQRAKTVAFFLMRAAPGQPIPQVEEGIAAAEWLAPETALALIGYAQVRGVLERALTLLGVQPSVAGEG